MYHYISLSICPLDTCMQQDDWLRTTLAGRIKLKAIGQGRGEAEGSRLSSSEVDESHKSLLVGFCACASLSNIVL